MRVLLYLGADDLLREVGHGVGQPALQAFGKVTDGLSESAWRSSEVCLVGEKRQASYANSVCFFGGGCHVRNVGLEDTSMGVFVW